MPLALTDDGAAVVAVGSPNRLAVVFLSSKIVAGIVEAPDYSRLFSLWSVSNDGRRVLYAAGSQTSPNGSAYVWDAGTGASTVVPLDTGEQAVSGVLSGDGRVAFVATTHARIVRFDFLSKAASSVFPRTPYCDDPSPVASGSLTRLHCSFSGSAAELEGRLTLDGIPVPILASVPGEIAIQAPWQRVSSPSVLSLDVASDSPFQPSQEVRAYDAAPAILRDSRGLFGMKAVKGDWSGLLTTLPPAGGTFHIYMTGLGPEGMPKSPGRRRL